MNPVDKIKKQRYQVEMKIIGFEEKLKRNKLTKNEEKELEFLKRKDKELTDKIDSLTT